MTLAPGATLGRYQILEPLGQGGMATVYRAFQPALDRVVALKVIRPGFAEDADFVDRFTREAKAVARLSHPNIVQVFDFDRVEGRSFLAMQYLEGGTLRDRLAQLASEGKLLPPAEVARIVRQVADALAYAHARGVVHRDMKPANVMLAEDGRAVVTDFGIAKIVGGTQLTQTGVGIGTPEYMSPEQGQGTIIDGRSDIYSLGVMAYELLTGQLPFTAETPFAVVLKHVRDPLPSPSKVNPAVGAATERVLTRALAKDPAQRYADATQLAQDLDRALAAEGGGRTPLTVPIARPAAAIARTPGTTTVLGVTMPQRTLALGAAAVLAIAVGGGAAALVAGRATEAPASSPTPTAAVTIASSTPAPATQAAPSPTSAPTASAPTAAPVVTAAPAPATPTPTGPATPAPTSAPTPVPTLAPTPAPTLAATPQTTLALAPTVTPAPAVARSLAVEKASYSRLEKPAMIFRGFPVGTRVVWEAHTEPDGVRYPEGDEYITTADPYRVVIDLGAPGQLPDPGTHVVHWLIDGAKYDVRVTVVP